MFIDARNIETGAIVDTDVCIIGAGAAGIAMAKEFLTSKLSVCVIESGGFDYDEKIQKLNEGQNTGKHRVNYLSRMRYFGGSTNCWGGNCAPFDEIDFAERPYVPLSQWPITLDDLKRYYPRVQELCKLGPDQYSFDYWRNRDQVFKREHVPVFDASVETKMFQRNQLLFGYEYRKLFEGAKVNVSVYLYSTILELEMNDQGSRVESARVITLNRKQYRVRAKVFILAAGIENARLLLLSDSVQKKGIGNSRGNVGRYYMGHLHFFGGIFIETPPYRDLNLYGIPMDRLNMTELDNPIMAAFQITPKVQLEEEILNYAAFLTPLDALEQQQQRHVLQAIESLTEGVTSLDFSQGRVSMAGKPVGLDWKVLCMGLPLRVYGIRSWVEQAPNAENKIELADTLDMFGQRQLCMTWTIHELEKKTIIRAHQLLANAFQRSGFGEVVPIVPSLDDEWSDDFVKASHFVGSTRMSASPKNGVVDANCKVFETENLYIAGGSVIPVSGATMVTYNLLALSLRLTDFIKNRCSKFEH